MKHKFSTLALSTLLAVTAFAHAQNSPEHLTLIDSDIRLAVDYPPIATKVFTSTPVLPLHRGAIHPAKGVFGPLGLIQMWSLRLHRFTLGGRTLNYPVIGSVRCSNFSDTGSFTRVIASTTQVKVALKADEILHSGGYFIEARQPIGAGENIPTLLVTFSGRTFILSLEEAAQSQKKEPAPQPRLWIASERASASDRAIALEAWRTANQSARAGLYAR
jgi:hypothetical protein